MQDDVINVVTRKVSIYCCLANTVNSTLTERWI